MSESLTPPSAQPAAVEPLALFEILVRENADSLTAFLRASVYDESAADDLFQETMLIAWRKIGDYDRTRPFGAWLRGIARRLVLAYCRKASAEMAVASEGVLECLDQRMAQVDRQSGDTLDEKIAALKDCIERLAPLYRQPVELHYRQHRSAEWIAEHLAISKDAVQKQLQRARAQLALCLQSKAVFAKWDTQS
jgi:RNA polymerase sigma-70 factor (ECF subfamily)